MKLWSNSFKENEKIPTLYTCDSRNINPHLAWSEEPAKTKSFALIMDDPDAPNGTWIHWLICNIPADVHEIPENSIPPNAKQVTNDFGNMFYGGPCPPHGTHRYFFRLYALNVPKLEKVTETTFYELVETYKIETTILIGLYERQR